MTVFFFFFWGGRGGWTFDALFIVDAYYSKRSDNLEIKIENHILFELVVTWVDFVGRTPLENEL